MDQTQTIKQMYDFNKNVFDHEFKIMCSMCEGMETYISRFAAKSKWITPEGKKIISQMADAYRKGRSDLKSMIDENYRRASELFAQPGSASTAGGLHSDMTHTKIAA